LNQNGQVTRNKLPQNKDGITLLNINDQQYVGSIAMGSPP
jgi:hypothetical protein